VIELEAVVSWNWPRLLLYVAGEEEWDYDADIQQVGGNHFPDVDQDATLITASDIDG